MFLCCAHEGQRHRRQQEKREADAAKKAAEARTVAAEARTAQLQGELAAMREQATKARRALMERALINKTMDNESSDEGTLVDEADEGTVAEPTDEADHKPSPSAASSTDAPGASLSHGPKEFAALPAADTLGETFEQARRSAGTYLDDESSNSMHTTFREPRPEDWCAVLNPAPSGTVRVNATSKVKEKVAAFAPCFMEENTEVGDFLALKIVCKDFGLTVEVVIPPPLVSPLLARRWLQKYQPPPLGKKDRCRMRLTALDGVLVMLRALENNAVTSLIAHGEAALVAVALLSTDVRAAAYLERHVATREANKLEALVKALEHVVLVAPMGFPLKSFHVLWKDFLPEAVCVACPSVTEVVVVVPLHHSAQESVRILQRNLLGSKVAELKFQGPAYRTMPLDLHIDFLTTPSPHRLQEQGGMVNLFVEGFAGKAILLAQHARLGFVGRAFEKFPVAADMPLPQGDITRPENVTWLERGITSRQI